MIRKLIAFLAIPVAASLALSPAMAEPSLRDRIVVAGPLVTLGDLFEDAGSAASQAVFRSPDIGTEGSVGALRVQAAARQHGLEWHNEAGIEQVAVKRSSRHITLEQIESAIAVAAAAKLGAQPSAIEIRLAGAGKSLHLDPAIKDPLEIVRLDLQPSGGFRAVLGLAGRADAPDMVYSGQAIETVEIVAPTRAIARGDVILAADVAIVRLPKSRGLDGMLRRCEDLIGMAAKQSLMAGKPVRESDLERPRIVSKNAIVTIVYQAPGLIVKAQGKTLGDAALGEAVTVLNTQSKRVLQAIVTAPGVVTVRPDYAPIAPQASISSNIVR